MSASPPNKPENAPNTPAGHEHLSCACGASFHSQDELVAHAKQFHAK